MRKTVVTAVFVLGLAGTGLAADKDTILSKGEEVFHKSCESCHTYAPPPKTAPPAVGLSNHYHEAFTDKEKAISHMVDFMKNPSKEKSVLLPIALERWGLMPAMTLSDEELRAVATWIWEVYPKEKKSR
ncbi:MAG: c-type cytochrome [Nitrospirales bacterium]|nr:c-type cytochrome [Nitrospirales bacterium]